MLTKELIEKVINKIIAENTKEYIKITPTPCSNLTIFESKFGGLPYLPTNFEVPTINSTPLNFLAQINCAELPKNDLLPTAGLLQFWIGRDELFGANLDGSPSIHRVVYFDEIDTNIKEDDVLTKYTIPANDEYSPFSPNEASFSLGFSRAMSTITVNDSKFEDIALEAIRTIYPDFNLDNDLYDVLDDEARALLYSSFNGIKHGLGAYPSFIQWDARDDASNQEYNISLLQVQSEYSNEDSFEIVWGDYGVANFFITSSDLKDLNFDNTLFSWDCA